MGGALHNQGLGMMGFALPHAADDPMLVLPPRRSHAGLQAVEKFSQAGSGQLQKHIIVVSVVTPAFRVVARPIAPSQTPSRVLGGGPGQA
jgi:hypothetical protein